MVILKMEGRKFSPLMFIELYKEARKLAPPRFLTLRLHPNRYKELYAFAEIPESIQIGNTLGPMGRILVRVCCVRAALGVADGIVIREDDTCPLDTLYFDIHGQPELVVQGVD